MVISSQVRKVIEQVAFEGRGSLLSLTTQKQRTAIYRREDRLEQSLCVAVQMAVIASQFP